MTSALIAEVLGGKKVLGRSIRNFADLAELIRKCLPAGSLVVLGEKLDLKNAALSEKLGIPQRTFTRRLSHHSRLTAAESDRTVRLARVYATAVEMIGNAHKAAHWLRTPNPALAGSGPLHPAPIHLGLKEIEKLFAGIRHPGCTSVTLGGVARE